ncbi:MAG: energy transducer TonB [Nibricoccus sp.]
MIRDVSELEVKPKPIKRVQPLYPAELKANKISGEAVVSFVVDTDGTVKNIRVERTTEQAFGEAAVAAVAEWKFEPGSIKGTPVPCQLSLPLVFSVQK